MKKSFKIYLIAALFSIFNFEFSISYAQDAVYNLIRRQYTVNTDGSIDIRYRKEIKLLRNRAITAYADKGETFILYNPAIDRLSINESYTLLPNGSRVQTPSNAFIDQLPGGCADCGRYNGLRERVVVHTGLEYNCIVVLDYTIHRQSSILNETIQLTEDCPVKRYEVIIDAPSDMDLNIVKQNCEGKFDELHDSHRFHLVASNIEQSIIDKYLPDNIYPSVTVSNGKEPRPKSDFEPLPIADNTIGELFVNDSLKFATAIRDYVTDYFHRVDIPMSLVDYKTVSAAETFRSGCGTAADLRELTVAMLRYAGFRCQPTATGAIVTINENGHDLEYNLVALSKRPPRLDGVAVEDQRTIDVSRILEWNGQNIGGGYSKMALPTENGSLNIDPAFLTSVRTAPLKLRNCDEHYRYSITLPSQAKLVNPIDKTITKSGIGTMRVTVRQTGDGRIDVIRELNINVADGVVTKSLYKSFRKMMQEWKSYNSIIIKLN